MTLSDNLCGTHCVNASDSLAILEQSISTSGVGRLVGTGALWSYLSASWQRAASSTSQQDLSQKWFKGVRSKSMWGGLASPFISISFFLSVSLSLSLSCLSLSPLSLSLSLSSSLLFSSLLFSSLLFSLSLSSLSPLSPSLYLSSLSLYSLSLSLSILSLSLSILSLSLCPGLCLPSPLISLIILFLPPSCSPSLTASSL